jgi:hypothetical protein
MDLVSTESASIQWLHPTQAGLVAGCASSEIVVAGADKVVTPTTVTQEVSTVVGSNRQQPLGHSPSQSCRFPEAHKPPHGD